MTHASSLERVPWREQAIGDVFGSVAGHFCLHPGFSKSETRRLRLRLMTVDDSERMSSCDEIMFAQWTPGSLVRVVDGSINRWPKPCGQSGHGFIYQDLER